ncbi:MAG: GTPase RsgA [Sulfolobales archaeon]
MSPAKRILGSPLRLLTRREIVESVLASDVVFEILDARVPEYLRNRFLENTALKNGKRLVIVLNKSDLVPKEVIAEWISYYMDKGFECIATSASKRDITMLKRILKSIDKGSIASFFGAPKVGKSSLINMIKGRSSATTSRYPGTPGYTRGVQLHRIYDIYILDTPGALPIDADPLEMTIRLRPPERIENPVKVAIDLIMRIEDRNPGSISDAYGISGDPIEILRVLAVKRGWIMRGGEPNVEEAAREIIRDYLDGKIRFYLRPQNHLRPANNT